MQIFLQKCEWRFNDYPITTDRRAAWPWLQSSGTHMEKRMPVANENNLPVGEVDFNKPIKVVDLYDDAIVLEDPAVLSVLENTDYPIVVRFSTMYGDEVAKFDVDGHHSEHTYQVENISDEDEVVLPEGAVRIAGRVIQPGDRVISFRKGGYVGLICTVIKTRQSETSSLYVKADSGYDKPYWASNKNLSFR